jgi:hypothetical protein
MAARPRPCAGRPLKISAAAGVVDALPTARTGEKHSRGLRGAHMSPRGLFLNPQGLFLRTSTPSMWCILSAFLPLEPPG